MSKAPRQGFRREPASILASRLRGETGSGMGSRWGQRTVSAPILSGAANPDGICTLTPVPASAHPSARVLLVRGDGVAVDEFLARPVSDWMRR